MSHSDRSRSASPRHHKKHRNDLDYQRKPWREDNRDRHHHGGQNRKYQRDRGDRHDRYDDNRGHRNRRDNRGDRGRHQQSREKQIRTVHRVPIDPPKTFIASTNYTSSFTNAPSAQPEPPTQSESSRLIDLKNKITPIESLWSSMIKQYLNISEFVEIYREREGTLAYDPIRYGKSIINYQPEPNPLTYDNTLEQSQIFSRAYFKLWQILCMGVLEQHKDRDMTIACVAEGPGGFIHALVDYRFKQQKGALKFNQDSYHAITLKMSGETRNAKDWSDKRSGRTFKRLKNYGAKINLSYGETEDGDLLKIANINHFSDKLRNKCQLVTGDGGIQCIGDREFEYQEMFNAKLFLAEIVAALHVQQQNGTFILKIYDISFEITRQLIMLLGSVYKTVKIVKPITSRPGNSEKYLLCEGFRGCSEEKLEELKKILQQWTEVEPRLSYFENKQYLHNLLKFDDSEESKEVKKAIKEANDWFVDEQCQKIEEGLKLADKYSSTDRSAQEQIKKIRMEEQMSFAYSWCKKYNIVTIEAEEEMEQENDEKK